MFVHNGIHENFDNVFYTIIEKMITEKVIIDDVKTLLLKHESRLERRQTSVISPLLSVNLSIIDSGSSSITISNQKILIKNLDNTF